MGCNNGSKYYSSPSHISTRKSRHHTGDEDGSDPAPAGGSTSATSKTGISAIVVPVTAQNQSLPNMIITPAASKPYEDSAKAGERAAYENFRISFNPQACKETYAISAGWLDLWLRYILHEYERIGRFRSGPKPRPNINQALTREQNTGTLLVVQTRDAKIYLVDGPLWHFLQDAYGSKLTLKRDMTSGDFSAFCLLPNKTAAGEEVLVEVSIINKDDVKKIPVVPLSLETVATAKSVAGHGGDTASRGSESTVVTRQSGTSHKWGEMPGFRFVKGNDGRMKLAQMPYSVRKVDIKGSTEGKYHRKELSGTQIVEPPAAEQHKGDSECSVSSEEDQLEMKHAPAVGLRNYGANCYLNAALQCLFCVPELNAYFLAEKFSFIAHATKRRSRSTCRDLANILGDMFNGRHDVVTPKALTGMCPSGQQDAHEFLWKRLFPSIQEETDPAAKSARKEGWGSEESWSWYRKSSTNIFDILFGGQYRGTVKCKSCGHMSVTYDPFLGISLPITGRTIDDCLCNEYESEELSKKVGYKCEKCSRVSDVIKLMEIDRAPRYLIIHLKRLVGGAKKINRFIEYPMQLNISKYVALLVVCLRHCTDKKKDVVYNLTAVCVHSGGPHSGHFYALGRRSKTWHLFNDESVRPVKEGDALGCEAYMLFYFKANNK